MLVAITDRRTRERVRDRIDRLAVDPDLQGKARLGELKGDHLLRAAGQRDRIVYRVYPAHGAVLVVAIGRRAQRLLRLRLLA
jgi:mRNA interferase RelE/StbE